MAGTIIDKFHAGGIPVMTIKKADAANGPAVFYIHGYSGKKEDGVEFGLRIADAGFMFISFDCWLHGERGDDGSSHITGGLSPFMRGTPGIFN